jgi:hypothetical protein
MRLRSGRAVGGAAEARATPRSAAEARAMLMGRPGGTKMASEHAPTFRRGVKAVFDRWTAMQLAVVNAWGGDGERTEGAGGGRGDRGVVRVAQEQGRARVGGFVD